MSDTESDKKINTLNEIKNKKKVRKETEKWKAAKMNNIQKAISARKKKFEEKKKSNIIEKTVNDIINESSIESDLSYKWEKKEKKKDKSIDYNNNNNEIKNIYEQLNNINKKVEKLYIMKKNKNQKPIIIENKNNKNKDEILNAIRTKM